MVPPQSLLLSRGPLLYLFSGYGGLPYQEEVFLVDALSSDLVVVVVNMAHLVLPFASVGKFTLPAQT